MDPSAFMYIKNALIAKMNKISIRDINFKNSFNTLILLSRENENSASYYLLFSERTSNTSRFMISKMKIKSLLRVLKSKSM